jgi:hypothetical protein
MILAEAASQVQSANGDPRRDPTMTRIAPPYCFMGWWH